MNLSTFSKSYFQSCRCHCVSSGCITHSNSLLETDQRMNEWINEWIRFNGTSAHKCAVHSANHQYYEDHISIRTDQWLTGVRWLIALTLIIHRPTTAIVINKALHTVQGHQKKQSGHSLTNIHPGKKQRSRQVLVKWSMVFTSTLKAPKCKKNLIQQCPPKPQIRLSYPWLQYTLLTLGLTNPNLLLTDL